MAATPLAIEYPKPFGMRSHFSLDPVFLRFINCTARVVRIFWLDYEGNKKLYQRLQPRQFLDVNTFLTHVWMFEDELTGDYYWAEGRYLYHPSLSKNFIPNKRFKGEMDCDVSQLKVRKIVPIGYPISTLRARCLQVIRDMPDEYRRKHISDLPNTVKADLDNLLKQKNCAQGHEPTCSCAIFMEKFML